MGRDTGRDSAHVWLYAQVRLHPEIGFQELQGRRGLWGPETLGQDLLARSPCPPQWSLDSPVPSHTWRRGCFLSAGLGWFPLGRTAHPVPHRLTPASLLPLPGWGGGRPGRESREKWPDSHPTGQPQCSGVAVAVAGEASARPMEEPPQVCASEENQAAGAQEATE